MEKWVAPRLTCGLGNRLFQLAATHKVSLEWSVPLVFAMPYCLPSEHGDFESIFKLFPNIPKLWKAEPLLGITQDKVFEYCPFPQVAPADRVLLRGMWQAAEYVSDSFKPSWDCIPNREELLAKWNLASLQQRAKTVFLHVRLGDYKTLPQHQVNLLSYFDRAMKSFPEDTRFLVFSDDIEIAKKFPIFNDRATSFVDEKDELLSLYLMSQCSGAITANSSFSWWGAAFGRLCDFKDTYKAYMPSQWMVTYDEPTTPIYPTWATVLQV